MPAEAVDSVLKQATAFTKQVAELYETTVAEGEVGVGGSHEASTEPIQGTKPAAALLYGRVQSGKTAAMVLTSALSIDNGFRIIIVLTADNLDLVTQTANRFRDLEGPRVLTTLKHDESTDWRAPELDDELLQDVIDEGLVFVCAKNYLHLPKVLAFFSRVDAARYPCLVFDDEADAATPDTTLQARTSGRPNAPSHASTIHRRVIENNRPGEEGESTLELLPHTIYVQVTASPYVLLLQRQDSKVRPSISFLLEPGKGYCGGARFFGDFDPERSEPPAPPIVLVPSGENQMLARRQAPQGLAASIDFALLAASTLANTGRGWPTEGYKHLSHTSPSTTQHTLVAEHIDRYLGRLRRELKREPQVVAERLEASRQELMRSFPQVPTTDSLMPIFSSAVRHSQVIRVNSESERAPYGPRLNFVVGGNILGRGVTINDLLVTYYLRQAKTSQMDTVLQHARMYGYRESLMPFTRLYVPRLLACLFKDIHESEQGLRELLTSVGPDEPIPIRVPKNSRPTRPSALETNELQFYSGRMAQISPHRLIGDTETAHTVIEQLRELGVPVAIDDRYQRATRVPFDSVMDILSELPNDPDDGGRWNVEAVSSLLIQHKADYSGGVVVYCRAFDAKPDEERSRARLAGPEVAIVRAASPKAPALAFLYWEDSEAPETVFPTLVVPQDMQGFVFAPG